jgi:signal transduction histidine kinase
MGRQRTLRSRLTLLYGGLFLVFGFLLLLIINGGVRSTIRVGGVSVAKPGQIPRPPTVKFVDPVFEQHNTDLRRLAVFSLVALLVMAILSIVGGRYAAGRALRPLQSITTTAQAISANNLHARLNLNGPRDEITELGATLDQLFGRLEASFESQRHFVANASHELRTPLTAERTLLQVALADPEASAETLRSTCEALLTLGDQQARLIDSLLTLADGEQGVERREPFDLADVVDAVLPPRRVEAAEQGIDVEESLSAAPATGDRSLVESLVTNLVDNGLRHNIEAGRVEIATTTIAGRAVLSVRNTGPVVPPDQVDRLFQPFQRLGAERVRNDSGHGLGLAIVAAIASAHGAAVVARARPEGGLDVEVTFPPPAGATA